MLRFHAVCDGVEKPFAWISLQPDDAISVGLVDRVFVAPERLNDQHVDRGKLEYLVPDSPAALHQIKNLHLTFHPPIYFHVRAPHTAEIFAGLAEIRLMIPQEPVIGWLKMVSRRFSDLSPARGHRRKTTTEICPVPISTPNCSIGLGVDFVAPHVMIDGTPPPFSRFIEWGDVRIHAYCQQLNAQIPTLSWVHSY